MSKKTDIYESWQASGELDNVLSFVKSCSTNLVMQKEMCEYLEISEQAFINLKKKHPEVDKMMRNTKLDLKNK